MSGNFIEMLNDLYSKPDIAKVIKILEFLSSVVGKMLVGKNKIFNSLFWDKPNMRVVALCFSPK